MPRPTIAEIEFGFYSDQHRLIRVIENKENPKLFDVVIANPEGVRQAIKKGEYYNWADAQDMVGLTPEQLGRAIADEGVIFQYKPLQEEATQAPEA